MPLSSTSGSTRDAALNGSPFAQSARNVAPRRTCWGRQSTNVQPTSTWYWSGLGTQLEILDAQVVLAESETALATARRDRARALVALERAVGVLGESPQLDQ